MRRIIVCLLISICFFSLAGCSSVKHRVALYNVVEHDADPFYGGTENAKTTNPAEQTWLGKLDKPGSAVLDTVLLPVDAIYYGSRKALVKDF
ncbi:MAG: hypothetical protein JEZ07_03115 [Phycisphaerae bacterium]|nr:hypothetical protein [Phycisphaerae bacterium]